MNFLFISPLSRYPISPTNLWPHGHLILRPGTLQDWRPQLTHPAPVGRVLRPVVDKVLALRVRLAQTMAGARVGHVGDGAHEAGAARVAVEQMTGG